MPELPEVETIVRALRHPADWPFREGQTLAEMPGIIGREIRSAQVNWSRSIAVPSVEDFCALLPGQQVRGVTRRGKFLVINLKELFLLIHLRMSGDLRVEPTQMSTRTHDRVIINFADGSRLVFNDTRKFGRVWLVENPDQVFKSLGPDPFEITSEAFHKALQEHHRELKPLLLDQSFVAGIGNIYSDEALFRAHLHPRTRSNELDEEQSATLLNAIRAVLEDGIQRNGASIDWVYRGGTFQNHFAVYQRTGQACVVCGAPIQREVIGQRSTHFCVQCQPEQKIR